jgi:hypothetical protein
MNFPATALFKSSLKTSLLRNIKHVYRKLLIFHYMYSLPYTHPDTALSLTHTHTHTEGERVHARACVCVLCVCVCVRGGVLNFVLNRLHVSVKNAHVTRHDHNQQDITQ